MKNRGNKCNENGPASETGPTGIEDEKKERAFGKRSQKLSPKRTDRLRID
jgi:hypothetical protein